MNNLLRRACTALPWRLWGRPIHPFHLAAFTTLVVLAYSNLVLDDTVLANAPIGTWLGLLSAAGALLFIVGWIADIAELGEWGLLLATTVWATRAALYVLVLHAPTRWTSFGLSLAWVIGSGGAYLLERFERHVPTLPDGLRSDE